MENIVHWKDPDMAIQSIKALLAGSIALFVALNFLPLRYLAVIGLWGAVLQHSQYLTLLGNLVAIKLNQYAAIAQEHLQGKEILKVEVEGELPKNLKYITQKFLSFLGYFISFKITSVPREPRRDDSLEHGNSSDETFFQSRTPEKVQGLGRLTKSKSTLISRSDASPIVT